MQNKTITLKEMIITSLKNGKIRVRSGDYARSGLIRWVFVPALNISVGSDGGRVFANTYTNFLLISCLKSMVRNIKFDKVKRIASWHAWKASLFLAIRICEHTPSDIRADQYIRSRPTPSEPLFILHFRCFNVSGTETDQTTSSHVKQCKTFLAHNIMELMKTSTGISVDVPLTICWFATGHPTP